MLARNGFGYGYNDCEQTQPSTQHRPSESLKYSSPLHRSGISYQSHPQDPWLRRIIFSCRSCMGRLFRIEGRSGLWRLDVICTCTELVLIIKCLVLLVSLLTTLAHPVQLELHPGYIYEGKWGRQQSCNTIRWYFPKPCIFQSVFDPKDSQVLSTLSWRVSSSRAIIPLRHL